VPHDRTTSGLPAGPLGSVVWSVCGQFTTTDGRLAGPGWAGLVKWNQKITSPY